MSMANETLNLTEKDNTNFFIRFLKYFIPWKNDDRSEIIRKIFFLLSIILFCISINELKDFLKADEKDKTYVQNIAQDYEPDFKDDISLEKNNDADDQDTVTPNGASKKRTVQKWAKGLIKRNSDVKGWIKIPDFNDSYDQEYINFPVLQSTDNEYYLKRNLDKEPYESGSIYADAWATINEKGQSDNITIYGHNMRYLGTSFTHLTEYKRGVDFLKKYPIIEFNTIYESGAKYIIVSAFAINIKSEQDDGKLFLYNAYRYFDNDEYKFDTWLSEIKKRSWYSSNAKCTANDNYITLSTCTNECADMRWVIIAKKLTADDNADEIVASYKDKDNKDIYFPKCWRDVYGNNKEYFGWDY